MMMDGRICRTGSFEVNPGSETDVETLVHRPVDKRQTLSEKPKDAREWVIQAAKCSPKGRQELTCAAAFDLGQERGIPLRRIKELCEQEGIKIVRCQLGCFP